MTADSQIETGFLAALIGLGRVRVDIDICEQAFRSSVGHLLDGDMDRSAFHSALMSLSSSGAVSWPPKSQTVPIGRFRFPAKIKVAAEARAPEPQAKPYVEMDSRIAHLKRGRDMAGRDELELIDAFLKRTARTPQKVLPINARSLTVFGDEKRLSAKLSSDGAGFFNGALTFEDMRCYVPADIYFAFELNPASTSDEVLIVENSESYHVFKTMNRSRSRYRAVAFGSGNTVHKSVQALRSLMAETGSRAIRYFGDVDVPGFRIPLTMIDTLARQSTEVQVLPAVDLYRQCLSVGTASRWDVSDTSRDLEEWRTDLAPRVRLWLGDDGLFGAIDGILASGARVAQEWLYDPA